MSIINPHPTLSISALSVSLKDAEILKGVDLTVKPGETHVIMGPNGSGKSTLLATLMGHPAYTVTIGSATLDAANLFDLNPTERARHGLFLAFQYPNEVQGITLGNFIRTAKNSVDISHDAETKPIGPKEFAASCKEALETVGLPKEFMGRGLNEGFSGGEKKRAEIAQMLLLKPTIALIDEIDSGLDVDALKEVATTIQTIQKEYGTSVVLVTHYARILQYISPDYVHIMADGKIVASGGKELAEEIEKSGYEQYA